MNIKTVSIGLPLLDQALMNGVPEGYAILLSGSPGSGTELFAKQFAAAGTDTENVIYITTTERDEDIKMTMESFGWKVEKIKIVNIGAEYYHKVLEKELLISKYREEGIPVNEIFMPSKKKKEREVNFLTRITYEIFKLKPPFRIVIDSLDFFLNNYDRNKVISALRTIKAHAQYYGGVLLVTMLRDVYDTHTQSGIEQLADIILEMEMLRTPKGFVKYLIIKKVRNHPEKTGIFKYTISEKGLKIVK